MSGWPLAARHRWSRWPPLDHGLIEGFAGVDDGAYDDMRAMLAAIQAAGWTSLTQTV